MWNIVVSFAHRAGFTRNEAAVALFLGAAITAGSLASLFRQPPPDGPDYSAAIAEHDSLFAARASMTEIPVTNAVTNEQEEVKVVSTTKSGKRSSGYVNINSARIAELQSLPGIGKATAEKIIAWRTTHGRFNQSEDIMKVPSIGKKKFEKMRHLIIVD